jgi:hypothetical protein
LENERTTKQAKNTKNDIWTKIIQGQAFHKLSSNRSITNTSNALSEEEKIKDFRMKRSQIK